jgi:hypothetical protein
MTCQCDNTNNKPTATMNNTCGVPSTFNPCLSLLTPDAEADLRSLKRTADLSPVIAGVAAGASSAALTVAAKGTFWTFYVQDFIASLPNMDNMNLTIYTTNSAKPLVDVFGGKFARDSSNPCDPCIDRSFCVGPLDTVTVIITNVSGGPFGATDTATLRYRSIYSGEAGFVCGPCKAPTASFNVEVK